MKENEGSKLLSLFVATIINLHANICVHGRTRIALALLGFKLHVRLILHKLVSVKFLYKERYLLFSLPENRMVEKPTIVGLLLLRPIMPTIVNRAIIIVDLSHLTTIEKRNLQ